MATETHTGRLIFGDGQVALEDGTVLAVAGSPTPCATAAARYAKWGQTQPVTVTGTTGTVDNSPVLFVTSIQWASDSLLTANVVAPVGSTASAVMTATPDNQSSVAVPPLAKKPKKKAARSGSKK